MTVGEVIKSLLRAVEEEGKDDHSCQPLIRLVSKNPKAVVSSLKEIPKKQAKRFFSSLKNLTDVILQEEAYVPESDKEDENEITPDKKSSECLLFLKYAAMFVQGFLEGRIAAAKEKQTVNKNTKKPLKVLPEVYDVALDLHNILFSLATCGPDASHTQSAILKVCQTFWLHNCEHRETVIAQCLPLLVFQTCDDDAQFPTIKSLHKLKDAFAVIDFTNPSSDSLRSLLLKLASNPLCLKLPEGKKFLATLLQDKDLCRDLHLAFRAQIPQTKKNILQAYGEIYHRAWKEALVEHEEDEEEEGEEINMNNARMIEHEALQDLMHASIHVAAPATLKSILSVLETLFQDKKNAQTAELLYRLYNPIIWRSLGFANPMIRKNAIVILEKVFPLNNPSTVNQTKEAIEKAAEALKNALQDRHPMVRIAAAQATCNICTVYWETLPATEIRMLLNHIVMGHASDSSSAAVRVSALEAITKLLDAPQSHAVLRALLPSMGNLIHDKTEKVRLATVNLLLKVKDTKGIRFYHVVPVSHLTARLAEEYRINQNPTTPVAKELTKLMLNSYFPQGSKVKGADQLKRTLTFFMTDPSAAIVFYANLVDLLEEEAVIKFIVMLLACLKSAVDTDQASKVRNSKTQKKRRRQQHQEEQKSQQQNLSASNTALMAALAETIAILVEALIPILEDDHPCKVVLVDRFAELGVINILAHFEEIASDNTSQNNEEEVTKRNDSLRTYAAILRCLAQLPQDTVDGIVGFIASSLSCLNEEMRPLHFIMSHLAPLCVWGMTEDIASTLAKSMESAFHNEDSFLSPCSLMSLSMKSRQSNVAKKKNKSKVDLPTLSPDVAFGIVNHILKGSNLSSAFIRQELLQSQEAYSCLKQCLEMGIIYAERLFVTDTGFGTSSFKESYLENILCACEAYGRFTLHKAAQDDNEEAYTRQAKTLLDWTTQKVVPAFLKARPEDNELHNLNISRISNFSDSLIMGNIPSASMSPPGKKSDLRRTPTRLLGGGKNGTSRPSTDSSSLSLCMVGAFSASLLQSACVLFAEELAIGSTNNSEDIVAAALSWCSVFDWEPNDDDDEEDSFRILKGLIPGFVRLAMQLCRSSANVQLWKQLFCKCHLHIMDYNEETLVKKALSSLLKSRFGDVSKLEGPVVDAIASVMESSTTDSKGCVELVCQVVLEHEHACRSLVLKLDEKNSKFCEMAKKQYPALLGEERN